MEKIEKCFYCEKQIHFKKIKYIQVPYGDDKYIIKLCNVCSDNNKKEAVRKAQIKIDTSEDFLYNKYL